MHIYFSGIGGVGLGPLAEIALDADYHVSGSDAHDSPMSRRLRSRGVTITTQQDGNQLRRLHAEKPVDWLVYTAALPEDHPELVFARQAGITVSKRDVLLATILKQKDLKLIAVAGTHGKTTTTGMLVWLCQQLGIPVSYSIGTTISFGPSGVFNPKSRYFIYECDEFDRNFLHFSPDISIITSVGYDHPDTYPTETVYRQAFSQFIKQSQHTILWQHDAILLPEPIAQATYVAPTEASKVHLPGEHNRQNGSLAIAALQTMTTAPEASIRAALDRFPGTHRRFEQLAAGLYSDYAHHPTEIAATLQMARELSDHVVAVYQPHQNRRQHDIQAAYGDSFAAADMIYWLPTYLSREDPQLAILSPETLVNQLAYREKVAIRDLDDLLWQDIQAERRTGSLVVAMGAGSIDSWLRQRLAAEPTESKS